MDYQLLTAFITGVGALLVLILGFKVNAFIALLISSILVGLISGMPPGDILEHMGTGMGTTLGFVAIVVGLGAVLGSILEHSGGTQALSSWFLSKFGPRYAPAALSMAGFLIAIPVFFDVAFILLVPVIYALQKTSGKSLLYFAIPLLAALAVTHAFIPPTPGPVAVADILGSDLGWIILFGFLAGIPATIVSGLIFGKVISERIFITPPIKFSNAEERVDNKHMPSVAMVVFLIMLPLVLILGRTVSAASFSSQHGPIPGWVEFIDFLGHPFSALIITVGLAMYFLGIRLGTSYAKLQEISVKSLGPAGIIILITGAGGVFKQMLVESGVGNMLADQLSDQNLPPILMAFLIAQMVRLLQGSSTVAMITAAGLMAPMLEGLGYTPAQSALVVLSIAAGASGFSHVNDSGFWLVSRYLGLTEIQTLKTWTLMTGVLALTGFGVVCLIWVVIG